MTKMPKVPENRNQGIFLNGTVKNEIVAVFIDAGSPQSKPGRARGHFFPGQCLERASAMNEARLSHLPFWGPSEGFFLIISRPSG